MIFFCGFLLDLNRSPIPSKPKCTTSQSQVASRNSCTTLRMKLKTNLTQVPSKLKPKLWTAAAATLLQSYSKVVPEAGPPKQSTPTGSNKALNFSQLKKKNFGTFSPLVLTIEGPLQIYQEAQDSPKGGFQNLESNFFPYLFLLSHRSWAGTSFSRKKFSNFSKGQGTNI